MSRTAETGRRLGRFASTRWGVLVVIAAVAGTALRMWVYRSSLGIPDSDEAVVGLMARHFAGGELATYFWGQAYGGSQEVLATVPLFWVAGSGWLTLRLVPIVLSAVTAVMVWRVGRRTIGDPAAVVAGWGKPARERTEQLQGLVTELRDHGYREATVGPFVVFAPPT